MPPNFWKTARCGEILDTICETPFARFTWDFARSATMSGIPCGSPRWELHGRCALRSAFALARFALRTLRMEVPSMATPPKKFFQDAVACMSKALLASVLIDTYNYGHFVEDAINSVLSQDFPADQLEILVVDDGSTDDTRERVTKYEPRVQYLYKPNGGQASAFNFGLDRARGDLIFFLDADAYWLPGKLRSLVWAFEQNPDVGMIYHRLQQFDQTANLGSDLFFVPLSGFLPDHFRDLLCYLIPPTSSLAFRRTVLE